jgi:hypothetical protein
LALIALNLVPVDRGSECFKASQAVFHVEGGSNASSLSMTSAGKLNSIGLVYGSVINALNASLDISRRSKSGSSSDGRPIVNLASATYRLSLPGNEEKLCLSV